MRPGARRAVAVLYQLTEIEAAFQDAQGRSRIASDLSSLNRQSNPYLVAFLAYCLHVTLGKAQAAGGGSRRGVLDKFAAIHMLDFIPTTDGARDLTPIPTLESTKDYHSSDLTLPPKTA